MVKKIANARWQPKPLWTARRLEELSVEVERLRKKVRLAESAIINGSALQRHQDFPRVNFPALKRAARDYHLLVRELSAGKARSARNSDAPNGQRPEPATEMREPFVLDPRERSFLLDVTVRLLPCRENCCRVESYQN